MLWKVETMDTRYTYAVGKIRALESKLLNKNKLERILESANIQDMFRELEETEYSEGLIGGEDGNRIEEILRYQMNKVYKLVDNLSLEPGITNLFLISRDIHNLKVFLKAKLKNIEGKLPAVEAGLFPVEKVKKMVQQGDYKELPKIIAEAGISADKQFSEDSDHQVVDILLDKAKYDYFFEVLAKHKSPFLRKLLEIKIDLANIKTFIRLKIRDKEKTPALSEEKSHQRRKLINKLLISNGKISKKTLLELFKGSLPDLTQKLHFSDYGKIVKEGIEYYQKNSNLTHLEKIFDDYFINFMKQAKYVVFGIEPIIGYLFAKEYEVRNIRTIILGKFNHLPQEMIRESLRETYV